MNVSSGSMMALLALLIFSCICNSLTLTTELSHVRELTDKDFKIFTDSQHVRVVYFSDSTLDKREDIMRQKTFLPAFDKSCKLLTSYDAECAKVDCSVYPVEDFCARPNIHNAIYTFRQGRELIELAMDSMFDLDSIISNILQVVLLQEVPILQSVANLRYREEKSIGKKDIIYSYHPIIGTYEHRVMMELAYAFKDMFQFALTTEIDSVKGLPGYNPKEKIGFWVLHCKTATDNTKPCPVTKYRDSIDLLSLAHFLHVIDLEPVTILPGGDSQIYDREDMHTVVIVADKDNIDDLKMEMQHFIPKYRGYIGFFLVDKTAFDITNLGLDKDVEVGTIALKIRGTTMWELMPQSDLPEGFIDTKLQPTVQQRKDVTIDNTSGDEGMKDDELSPVEIEDDVVAETARVARGRNLDLTHVVQLRDETFTAEIQNRDCLIVLFYLVFDARSTASLFSFLEASRYLADDSLHPLAIVECHDDRDVCVAQNITSYPTIKIFQKGKKPTKYSGMYGNREIYSFVKLFLADAPMKLNTFEEAKQFLSGNIPKDFNSVTDVSVLGLFTENSDAEKKAFRKAARKLHGQMLFGETTGEVAQAIAKTILNTSQLPKIVVHKRNDEFRPIQVCPSFTKSHMVVQCARDGAQLMFPELTPNNFPKMYNEKIPFLILFTHGRNNDIYRAVGALAADVNIPNVVYCWMDLDDADDLPKTILMKYYNNQIASTPALVLVDYQKGDVYHYDKTSYERAVLVPWIVSVAKREVRPAMDLPIGEWKPLLQGYDFLNMMDEGTGKEKGDFSVANEYGLGFDSDGNYIDHKKEEFSPDLEEAEKEIHDELQRLSRFYPKRGGHVDKTETIHPEHSEL